MTRTGNILLMACAVLQVATAQQPQVQQQVTEAVLDQGGQAAQIQEQVEQIVMEKIAEAVQRKADEVVTVVEACVDEKKEVL